MADRTYSVWASTLPNIDMVPQYRGEWQAIVPYEPADVVTFNGGMYIATATTSKGESPATGTKWAVIIDGKFITDQLKAGGINTDVAAALVNLNTIISGVSTVANNSATASSNATVLANAANTAAMNAQTDATTGITKANSADTKAGNAQTTANTALANAATADGKAVTAQNAANTADGKAVNAQNTADSGVTKANAAQTTANTAVTNAATAQTGADTANNKLAKITDGIGIYTDGNVIANAAVNTAAYLRFTSAGKTRWQISKDTTTESGTNVGANFTLGRYSDDGTLLETTVLISRNSGNIGIGTSSPQMKLHVAGTVRIDNTFTLNGAAASNRIFYITTNSSARWAIIGNNTAEAGSNVGTDFAIYRYSDAGAFIAQSLRIERSTGRLVLSDGQVDFSATFAKSINIGANSIWTDTSGVLRLSIGVPAADTAGNPIAIVRAASTRPTTGLYPGYMFFDTSINRPIWRNGANTAWVYHDGMTIA